MTIDIGNIIISKLTTLPFLDKYAGVVKVLSYTDTDKDGKLVKKTFPAECKTPINTEPCDTSRYFDLCPDDKKKSVLYLEDKGVRFTKIDGKKIYYVASFDLVCWLNLPKLGVENCSFSAIAVTNIIKLLIGKGIPVNNGIYQQLFIKPVSESPKNINPFSKYSYNVENQQFLIFPYDFFVMSIEASFLIDADCIEDIILQPEIPCLYA